MVDLRLLQTACQAQHGPRVAAEEETTGVRAGCGRTREAAGDNSHFAAKVAVIAVTEQDTVR